MPSNKYMCNTTLSECVRGTHIHAWNQTKINQKKKANKTNKQDNNKAKKQQQQHSLPLGQRYD